MNISKWFNIPYFIKTFLLMMIIVFTILLIIGYSDIEHRAGEISHDEYMTVHSLRDLLFNDYKDILADLDYVSKIVWAHDLETDLDEVKTSFQNLAVSKKIYDQIRYLDAAGQEIIRINYNSNMTEIVEEHDLQDKSNRDYFIETMNLKDQGIFISQLDLNIENGEIEIPEKPMVRFAKKMSNEEGMVVINYLAEDFISQIEKINTLNVGKMYLLNKQGEFIYSDSEYRDFAFMYAETGKEFVDIYPDVWKKRLDNQQIKAYDGLFTIVPYNFTEELGSNYYFNQELWLVSYVGPDVFIGSGIYTTDFEIYISIFQKYVVLILIFLIISLGMSFFYQKRKAEERMRTNVLEFISQVQVSSKDHSFLNEMLLFLLKESGMKYGFIATVEEGMGKTLVIYNHNQLMDNVEYPIMGTPTEKVHGKSLCHYSKDVRKTFPNDFFLEKIQAESYIAMPLFKSDGTPLGILSLVDDVPQKNFNLLEAAIDLISTRSSHELELLRFNEQLEELLKLKDVILETVEEGIVVYNRDLVCLEWNQYLADIVEVKRESYIGKHILDFFPQLKENGVYDELLRVIEEGVETVTDNEYISPSGRKYWFRDTNRPLLNASGEIIGILKTLFDITSYKNHEEDLGLLIRKAEAANIAKTRFLANMSHEVRTPMNGVLGMLDLALLSEIKEERQDYIETAKRSGQNLVELLTDLLEMSKIEENGIELNEAFHDLHAFVEDVMTLFSNHSEKNSIHFTYIIDERIPQTLFFDKVRLKQVLVNLINNAFKFTNEGSIVLSLKMHESTRHDLVIEFGVKDTGIGIKSEHLDMIFNRFSQVDQSSTRAYGGVGLGLTIIKGILEKMKTKVVCHSVEGLGTEFSFKIKCAYSDRPIEVEEKEHIEFTRSDISEKTILIIEDDSVNQKLLQISLENEGFKTLTADHGEKGIELYKTHDIDMVLLDLSMPFMNGYEVLEAIKVHEKEDKKIPIIAQTAFVSESDKESCIVAGFDDFIGKPIDLTDLKRVIKEYL